MKTLWLLVERAWDGTPESERLAKVEPWMERFRANLAEAHPEVAKLFASEFVRCMWRLDGMPHRALKILYGPYQTLDIWAGNIALGEAHVSEVLVESREPVEVELAALVDLAYAILQPGWAPRGAARFAEERRKRKG